MTDQDLCYLSACEALQRFSDRSLSPVELLQALIKQSERLEPQLNAFTQTYFEEAMDAARAAEQRYTQGQPIELLDGLCVAIKEDKGVAGKPTSAGSKVFSEGVAGSDALPVQKIRAAGGIIHSRTNVCEMGTAAITGSEMQRPTHNPWHPEYNSGGSSGGAAASLAAGTTTLANGSDYCGSIRVPAASCGVVGYKPPRGRNPVSPFFNLDWYDHDGPLARTVGDCALLQNAMSGQHPGDLFSLPDTAPLPLHYQGSLKGKTIGWSMDLGYVEVDPQVQANTRETLALLKELGAELVEIDLNWTEQCLQAFRDHGAAIFGAWVADYLPEHSHEMTDYARAYGATAEAVSGKAFMNSMAQEAYMWQQLAPVLQRCDALICPTLALPAVPLEHSPLDENFSINGKPVAADFGWLLTYPFNMLSPLPVISIPSGFAANGIPTGIQIIGRPYDDLSVFSIAGACEAARPWLNTADQRPRFS
ncbi:amidase [Aliamphritea spongicola]|uniref:amidase n=1 Tax=Aliamphritea spongicola TaxID=707589 RepID=UPI00196B7699|nr:amidase [Aliamphritea spongicola]MBN3562312.1 amidase [Aliamphritea spongicola]